MIAPFDPVHQRGRGAMTPYPAFQGCADAYAMTVLVTIGENVCLGLCLGLCHRKPLHDIRTNMHGEAAHPVAHIEQADISRDQPVDLCHDSVSIQAAYQLY